ncbi:MAG TPA: hypothetical protein VFT48_11650, partial [Pyrinomonadaceae bacterium]|nr:hypothetical protein [Pyrinomonadaceae bacterium]
SLGLLTRKKFKDILDVTTNVVVVVFAVVAIGVLVKNHFAPHRAKPSAAPHARGMQTIIATVRMLLSAGRAAPAASYRMAAPDAGLAAVDQTLVINEQYRVGPGGRWQLQRSGVHRPPLTGVIWLR